MNFVIDRMETASRPQSDIQDGVALCYAQGVPTTITQRELRNNSADIMRRLQVGESFTLTSNGRVIGSLLPASEPTRLPITRARTQRGFEGFPLRPSPGVPLSEILDDLREDRV